MHTCVIYSVLTDTNGRRVSELSLCIIVEIVNTGSCYRSSLGNFQPEAINASVSSHSAQNIVRCVVRRVGDDSIGNAR